MTQHTGYMFAGQGAQYVGMGKDLYEASTAARAVFDQADDALESPVTRLCFNGPEADLTDTANCQPAIYVVSTACAAALQERVPIAPAVTGGLSLGEFSALHAAGALDFIAGLRLLQARGRLMADACKKTQGSMAAVINADPDLVARTCEANNVDVANLNCPGQIVISGEKAKLDAAVQALKDEGVSRIIPLSVAGAFHSRCMSPAAKVFAPMVDESEFTTPACPVAQNAAGTLVESPTELKHNIKAQVDGSVKWEACVRAMIGHGIDTLVELGPGNVLTGFMRRIDRRFPVLTCGTLEQIDAAAEQLQKGN